MTKPAPAEWRVGDVTVTQVVEQTMTVEIPKLLPTATAEEVVAIPWLTADQIDGQRSLHMSFNSLVVRAPSCLVLVDTCVGNDREGLHLAKWNGMQTGYLQALAAAGVDREAVDVVLCTHLHVDHVGWNSMKTAAGWRPTFPSARYLIDRTEYAHWRAHTDDPEVAAILRQSIDPIEAAGLLDLIDARRGYGICEEIKLTPTPGHSPGHVSVRITSGGESALITGDAIHHPCQMARPEWRSVSDFDAAQAEHTRRELLAGCESHGSLLIGSHFAGDPSGRVRRDGAAWRFEQG